MKKPLILISTLFFSLSILYADIPIKNGWQLVGATENMKTSIFNDTCVDYLWKYDTTQTVPEWKLHVANGRDYAHSMKQITLLTKGDGFWVKANADCNVSLSGVKDPSALFESGETWQGLVYNTVVSPTTGRTWLDRNLGASQVCVNATDTACYGDYYQWGRLTDGHEKVTSATTTTIATGISATNKFITGGLDWTSSDLEGFLRNAQWSKTDGNSICPIGYRAPTYEEINKETILAGASNRAEAVSNFLKIPSSGFRNKEGTQEHTGAISYLWVNQVNTSSQNFSYYLYFASSLSGAETVGYRADAYPVRCIKN